MRELPFPEDLLKPRDDKPLLYVPAKTWGCLVCELTNPQPIDDEGEPDPTTITWLGQNTEGPHGRCRQCGQKYVLTHAGDRHIPSIEEQMGGDP